MNSKFSGIIKNISYSFSANLLSTIISMVLVTIVPKALGEREYGFWQLYMFYSSYVGFFHFGWCDGVYLRYGGMEYDQLDKSLFHSQYWLLMVFEVFVALGISFFAVFGISDADRIFVLIGTALCCILLLPRTLLQYLLQGTNRIKEYAKNAVFEKSIYAALVLIMIFIGVREYKYLLLADIIAKTYTMVSLAWVCQDIVFGKGISLLKSIREAWINISAGIKLMFANVASMLIIGIVRFSIERNWDVPTFGKISLSISVSNLMMVFINAVSVVMFPLIRRMPQERWAANYKNLRIILVVPILGALLIYFPAKVILSTWLPNYAESLNYMALMFPICLFEGKMAMLVNTYMKALRMEKTILLVNGVSVVLSAATTAIIVFWLQNLTLAVLSIVILLAFRCALAEIMLARKINIFVIKDIVLEFLLVGLFIGVNWFVRSWISVMIYGGGYFVYVVIKGRIICNIVSLIRNGTGSFEY